MTAFAPPGWPSSVRPPGAPEWQRTASAWLLDVCPPEYRGYPALRRHAIVLARLAVLHVAACQSGVSTGIGAVRGDLREHVSLEVVDAAVRTLERESARLIGVRRAAGLIEEALSGQQFVAKL